MPLPLSLCLYLLPICLSPIRHLYIFPYLDFLLLSISPPLSSICETGIKYEIDIGRLVIDELIDLSVRFFQLVVWSGSEYLDCNLSVRLCAVICLAVLVYNLSDRL